MEPLLVLLLLALLATAGAVLPGLILARTARTTRTDEASPTVRETVPEPDPRGHSTSTPNEDPTPIPHEDPTPTASEDPTPTAPPLQREIAVASASGLLLLFVLIGGFAMWLLLSPTSIGVSGLIGLAIVILTGGLGVVYLTATSRGKHAPRG